MPPSARTADYDLDYAQDLMDGVRLDAPHPFVKGLTFALFSASAICLLTVVLSYSPFDTTSDTAGIGGIQNKFGAFGASLANFLMQLIGLASVWLGIMLLIAAVRTVIKTARITSRLDRLAIITLYLTCLICFAGALSGFPIPESWPMAVGLGGWLGDMIFLGVRNVFDVFHVPMSGFFTTLLLFIIGAFCLARMIGVVSRDVFAVMDASGLLWATFRMGLDRIIMAVKRRYDAELASEHESERHMSRSHKFGTRANDEDYDISYTHNAPRSSGPGIDDYNTPVEPEHSHTAATSKAKSKAKPMRRASAKSKVHAPDVFDPANSDFSLPDLRLLKTPPPRKILTDEGALRRASDMLHSVLDDYGVKGEMGAVRPGPVVTLYEFEPAPGVKSQRVINLAPDIARNMSAESARIAVVPGRNAMGVELPNRRRETVWLRSMLESQIYQDTDAALPLIMGEDIGGEAYVADLSKMPHLLVAGTTGSGKSVAINAMILSLMYKLPPDQCKFIMIDPKMLELSVYDGIPHLLAPVVTEPKKAVVALKWTVREMEDRYRKMSKMGVRNMAGYNEKVAEAKARGEIMTRTVMTGYDSETGEPIYETEELDYEPMPFIVVIIDEMADLMMVAGKDIEGAVQRLAQMARAAGIHMIMATQRPSVDVITGTIKANFPCRVSFRVGSSIDSRTILGETGAEHLLGNGDMLFMGTGRSRRLHGPFVSDAEVEKIASFMKSQGAPSYLEDITAEPDDMDSDADADGTDDSQSLFDQAVAIVARDRKASTSYIQRRLSIGYNRAANLIEQMEDEGMIGPSGAGGKREIFLPEHNGF